MSTQAPEAIDLTAYTFTQKCDLNCGREAVYVAKGCMDKEAVMLCDPCLQRGLDLVRKAVHMYQQFNKRICICADCHRPLINLSTHLEIARL